MVRSSWCGCTPSPTDSAPCGSKSTSSTRRPYSASAAPRLIVEVVLPTPPFWLHSAMTRAGPCRGSGGRARAEFALAAGPSAPGRPAFGAVVDRGHSAPCGRAVRPEPRLAGHAHPFRPRVRARVDLAQLVDGDQRVDLGRRDRRVAQQFLHDAHVRAAVEQVGREGVPQRVRRDARGQPGPLGRGPQHHPGGLPRQRPAAGVEEQPRACPSRPRPAPGRARTR